MKNVNDVKNSVNVTDIQCKDCIKYKAALDLFEGGLCTRLCMDCSKARHICIKTGWYAEMCTASAIIDKVL